MKARRKYDIVTIGDIVIDYVVHLDDCDIKPATALKPASLLLEFAQKIPVRDFNMFPGGNALNTAVGFSRLGLRAAIYTHVGSDRDTDFLLGRMREEGVAQNLVSRDRGRKCDKSVVIVTEGERTILSYHRSKAYRLPDFSAPWAYLTSLGDGYASLYRTVAQRAHKDRLQISYNPGTRQILDSPKAVLEMIGHCACVCVNDDEARRILGTVSRDPHELLGRLCRTGARYAAITLGRHGVWASDGVQYLELPVFPATRIDSTGAGDAFASAFTAALIHGYSLAEAMRWGSVNAASEIHSPGVQNGLLAEKEIKKRLSSAKSFIPKRI